MAELVWLKFYTELHELTLFVKDNKLSGTLPTSINTFFTIVTNSSSIFHTTTLYFDESNIDRLIINSNISQNVGVNWVRFYQGALNDKD